MKNKPAKPQAGTHKAVSNIFPIQVAGVARSCQCGVLVRRGIMWEYKNVLHCSKLCASTQEQKDNKTENTVQ